MTWVLAVLLLVLPWMELWLMVSLDMALPVVVFQALATAAAGWWLSRGEDLSLWSELESDVQNHRVPTEEGLDAMLTILGGWCLIVPGWISDLGGAALLTPPLRRWMIPPIRGMIRDYLL